MSYYICIENGVISYVSPFPMGIRNEIEISEDDLIKKLGFSPTFLNSKKSNNISYLRETINQI